MPDPISLALGTKEIVSIIGVLIGGNLLSFKYIFHVKLNQIEKLGKRIAKVEEHRWSELDRVVAEVHAKLDQQYKQYHQMNLRIDEIFTTLSKRNVDCR